MADALSSKVWDEAHEASRGFRDALQKTFLENPGRLRELTLRFGVF
jgi:hypothetical protein